MKEIKKNKKGITLVSLVVTIIILIILAGVSINMTLGEGGIITIAKRAKENMELAQIEEQEKLNELYMQIEKNEGLGEKFDYDTISKLNDFKKKIADYIEEAGGIKPDYTADVETFGERIKGIVKEVTKDATATEEDIVEGKTAWVNGKLVNGILNLNSGEYNLVYKEANFNQAQQVTFNFDGEIVAFMIHSTSSPYGGWITYLKDASHFSTWSGFHYGTTENSISVYSDSVYAKGQYQCWALLI